MEANLGFYLPRVNGMTTSTGYAGRGRSPALAVEVAIPSVCCQFLQLFAVIFKNRYFLYKIRMYVVEKQQITLTFSDGKFACKYDFKTCDPN